jgi:hypothetical protein
MADNINDDTLNNSTSNQSEIPSDNTTLANDTQIISQKQETENMEVHHHPDLHHNPKKWKEYFLEFLMIFLAVTMGFFAENIREHYANKEKEHHYIQNLVADLNNDLTQLDAVITIQKLFHQHLDSALSISIDSLTEISKQDTFLYHFFPFYSLLPTFNQNENTLSQLKSGGFSIFNNQATIDSISKVYNNIIKFDNDFYIATCWDAVHQAQKIMRLPIPAISINDPNLFKFRSNYQVFIEYNKKDIIELYNKIGNAYGTLETTLKNEKFHRENMVNLLKFLHTRYSSD